jgi:hypothetical protein
VLPALVSSKLADRWGVQVVTPAFAFWAGGAVAWYTGQHGFSSGRLTRLAAEYGRLPGLAQAVLVIAALMLVSASGAVVRQASPLVIRALEGYRWPKVLSGPLRQHATGRRATARTRVTAQLEAGRKTADPAAEEILRSIPADPGLVQPTRLGNILRTAEGRPGDAYGLDAVVCWPYLWLLLDSATKTEISGTRSALDTGARGYLWGALFVVWTAWNWWALPVALLVCAASYYGSMIPAARDYGDLVAAAFALHRFALYTALRWPVPAAPAGEPEAGADLAAYLWRGLAPAGLAFTGKLAPGYLAGEGSESEEWSADGAADNASEAGQPVGSAPARVAEPEH